VIVTTCSATLQENCSHAPLKPWPVRLLTHPLALRLSKVHPEVTVVESDVSAVTVQLELLPPLLTGVVDPLIGDVEGDGLFWQPTKIQPKVKKIKNSLFVFSIGFPSNIKLIVFLNVKKAILKNCEWLDRRLIRLS
jgi:hypothetical protein